MTNAKKMTNMLGLKLFFFVLLFACNGPVTLFKGQYAHQRYAHQLKNAGLENSLLYRAWFSEAVGSLKKAQSIGIPYQEQSYFKADQPQAMAFAFEARKGERIEVSVTPQGLDSAQLFIDLFQQVIGASDESKHVISADTNAYTLSYEVDKEGIYLLRIQPELLAKVSYQLQITAEASLSSPIATSAKVHMGSFYGDDRDAGIRKHEGVDLFAPRLTPVVAAADGQVSSVGTNNLGGKVIWLSPKAKSYRLYYAHLDSQFVQSGKEVRIGDTLGLVGNTGNARTTPPHLHFGIYTSSGAVDPLPFLKPEKSNPPRIAADIHLLGDTLRIRQTENYITIGQSTGNWALHTPVAVDAAMQNSYRISLPDGSKGLIPQRQLGPISKPLQTVKLASDQIIYQEPNILAAQLGMLVKGTSLSVLAIYKDFYLVDGKVRGWVLQE